MKRIIALMLSAFMTMALEACGSEDAGSSDFEGGGSVIAESNDSGEESGEEASDFGNNILVAYFSCTNTTEQIAEWIADKADADLYEITPETPYTDEDLNYNKAADVPRLLGGGFHLRRQWGYNPPLKACKIASQFLAAC